jgi:hypothetical protein
MPSPIHSKSNPPARVKERIAGFPQAVPLPEGLRQQPDSEGVRVLRWAKSATPWLRVRRQPPSTARTASGCSVRIDIVRGVARFRRQPSAEVVQDWQSVCSRRLPNLHHSPIASHEQSDLDAVNTNEYPEWVRGRGPHLPRGRKGCTVDG